tara:strand:- start:57 stop:482 length:426 start_codon:yes stop_codon:yes gene_type:complete
MTNYDKIVAKELGQSLKGLSINLLVSSVKNTSTFLKTIFNIELFQQTDDFAIVKYEDQIFQIHADKTYLSNPLPSLLPENGARGAGIEIRLYNSDPDVAEKLARKYNYKILQSCTNKSHGLRECYILDNDGYCWIPSRKQN